MKNDRIAVALLGAGRIGQEHAKNLAAFPQVEVVVVCDPRIEGAEALRPLVRAKDITPSPEEGRKPKRRRCRHHLHSDRYPCRLD